MAKRTDLGIPYGVADFRTIREEGLYYVDKTENFRSLFHYYGILSMAERREGMSYFRVPNACVEKQLII